MNNEEEIRIGSFQMTSREARISDPCYDVSTWCAGTVGPVKNGSWDAYVVKSDEGSWGKRIGYLIAHHVDIPKPRYDSSKWERKDIDVGVDSGQAGIFDTNYFKDDGQAQNATLNRDYEHDPICVDEPWYSLCCDRTLGKMGAGTIPFGCVSSSGYGDGSYRASVITRYNKVVAIMIDFGLDCENEDGLEECQGCGYEFYDMDLNCDGYCADCEEEMEDEEYTLGNGNGRRAKEAETEEKELTEEEEKELNDIEELMG